MSSKRLTAESVIGEASERVRKRAQWEAFEFSVPTAGKVSVANGSYADPEEHSYTVTIDPETGAPVDCDCPFREHNDGPGKHMVAVALREPIRMAAMGRVASDGGQSPDSEPEASDEDSGPCDCPLCSTPGLGCFDGFEGEE